jgi:AAA domain
MFRRSPSDKPLDSNPFPPNAKGVVTGVFNGKVSGLDSGGDRCLRKPKMLTGKTCDPQTEQTLLSFITGERFDSIPEHKIVPPEAINCPITRLIWGAAIRTRIQGIPVNVSTINRQIVKDGADKRLFDDLHEESAYYNSYEDWAKLSGATDHTASYEMVHGDVLHYYQNRETIRIGEMLVGREIGAEEAMGRIEKLLHATNGRIEIPKARSLLEFGNICIDNSQTLLGNRFLCRQGGLLIVAPSGVGKSSASVQQDIEWSCGRASFGIKPNGPLRILTIQAEDDEGDMIEFVSGVRSGLELTNEEEELCKENCRIVGYKSLTGVDFLKGIVKPLLNRSKPDILRLNPFLAYLGADISNATQTALFLRNTLNPLLEEFNCACVLMHHTGKCRPEDKSDEMKPSNWMYRGIGSSDITNWGRAIIAIDPTHDSTIYKWIAAKRGNRVGWVDDEGNTTQERFFSHSTSGGIRWEASDIQEAPEKPKKNTKGQFKTEYTHDMILDRMHMIDEIKPTALLRIVKDNTGMSPSQFWTMWNKLKADNKIIEGKEGWRKLF